MSTFSEEYLVKRLKELGSTQQSIQTLSLWLIHHRKHHKRITEVWLEVLKAQEKANAKLNMLYLANDVIQNSRRKNLNFPTAFIDPLDSALGHIYSKHRNDKSILSSVERVINIWKERKIYEEGVFNRFRKHKTSNSPKIPDIQPETRKTKTQSDPAGGQLKKKKSSPEPALGMTQKKDTDTNRPLRVIDSEDSLIELKPPELSDVIRAILALENAPSADAVIRQRIASLPPEVRDVSMLERVQDKDTLDSLKKQVDDACELLESYNKNLDKEISDRGKLSDILHDFRRFNGAKVQELVTELENYNSKLQNAIAVREEVKNHANKLPDMSKLPNVTQGRLNPLPTAGDLFTK